MRRWSRPLILALAAGALRLSGCGLVSPTLAPRSAPSASVQWVPAAQVAPTALGLLASAHHSVRLDVYELGNPSLVAGAHRGPCTGTHDGCHPRYPPVLLA